MAIYFEPVNLNQWDMFKKVKSTGHVEPFLAVSNMHVNDLMVLHVGSQNKQTASGIYAYGTIVSEPYLLTDHPDDYCNNKNTVDVRIDYLQESFPIVKHEDCKDYIYQFRSVHKIRDNNEAELWEMIRHNTQAGPGITKLNGVEREIAEQLLLVIKNSETNVTYEELSERTNSHPNPHV